MAYWLYCQACKQWSKSPAPLSEGKSCPFCDHLLTKAKKHFYSRPDDVGIVDPKDSHLKPSTQENDITLKVDQNDPVSNKESGRQATPSVPESPVISETSANTPDEAPTELDTSAAIEIAEPTAVSETSTKPEASDLIEVTKEMTSTVINDVPDDANTPVADGIPDEPEKPVSDEANETGSSAAQMALKATESLTESQAFEEAEISEDKIQEETASSPVQNEMEETKDPKVSDTSETLDGQEALESDESPEETESLVMDDYPDQSESGNTPAHRMYIEDKRRKRKQR